VVTTRLQLLAATTAAAILGCSGIAFAADTYQANLGPMPLNAADRANMVGRGEAAAPWTARY
jgi:hypothetical protein